MQYVGEGKGYAYGPLATLLKTIGPSLHTLKLSGIVITDKLCEVIALHCRSESTSLPTDHPTRGAGDGAGADSGTGAANGLGNGEGEGRGWPPPPPRSRAAMGGDPRDWDWDGGRFNYDSTDARMNDTIGRSRLPCVEADLPIVSGLLRTVVLDHRGVPGHDLVEGRLRPRFGLTDYGVRKLLGDESFGKCTTIAT